MNIRPMVGIFFLLSSGNCRLILRQEKLCQSCNSHLTQLLMAMAPRDLKTKNRAGFLFWKRSNKIVYKWHFVSWFFGKSARVNSWDAYLVPQCNVHMCGSYETLFFCFCSKTADCWHDYQSALQNTGLIWQFLGHAFNASLLWFYSIVLQQRFFP